MHFRGLNLNLLVSLDALLTEKSVSRAAEKLHVTQPAMSASLHQLRQYLSDPLLQKVGRKFELTPRALAMSTSVKELLLQIDALLNAEQFFDPLTAKRTFRLAMSANMAELLGVPLIKRLMSCGSAISLQIVDLAADSLRRVEDGELDFCVTVAERPLNALLPQVATLSSEDLYADRFVLVGAKGNPVMEQPLTYDDFCQLRYIELRLSGNFKSISEVMLERQSHRPHINAWMPTPQTLLATVSASNAVAIVPERLFELHKASLSLRSMMPPLDIPNVKHQCVWHPRSDIDAGHEWLRRLLVNVAVEG